MKTNVDLNVMDEDLYKIICLLSEDKRFITTNKMRKSFIEKLFSELQIILMQ